MQLVNTVLGLVETEKSTRLQEQNKYVFRIHADATKVDVERFFREFYAVVPRSVRVLSLPKKVRQIGRSRIMTRRRAEKRAVVTLKKGDSIELVDVRKADDVKSSSEKK